MAGSRAVSSTMRPVLPEACFVGQPRAGTAAEVSAGRDRHPAAARVPDRARGSSRLRFGRSASLYGGRTGGPARRLLTGVACAVKPAGGFADKSGHASARGPGGLAEVGMTRSGRGRRRLLGTLATLASAGVMLPLAAASAGAATTARAQTTRAQ